MQIRSVGIDLGKTTFHLVALGDNGRVLLKKKFTQKQLARIAWAVLASGQDYRAVPNPMAA